MTGVKTGNTSDLVSPVEEPANQKKNGLGKRAISGVARFMCHSYEWPCTSRNLKVQKLITPKIMGIATGASGSNT